MPTFSPTSMSRLNTCERDLQTVMMELIKWYDVTVIFGHRTPEEQFELFKKGRQGEGTDAKNYKVVKISEVVTYKDGFKNKSKHNFYPSRAVDIAPYPIDWKDVNRFYEMAGRVLQISDLFLKQDKISKPLVWGGHWKTFIDRPHFQI